MAPTPYTAGYQLDIVYTVQGFTHRVQLPCGATNIGGSYNLLRLSMSDYPVASAVADFTNLAKPWFAADVTFTQWILQQHDGGVFIPVAQSGIAVVGTNAGTTKLATQATVVFRDLSYLFYRLVLMEVAFPAPAKDTIPSGTPAVDDLIIDMLPSATSANPIWQWVRSRGNHSLNSALGYTNTFNRRFRRKRGLG